MRYRTDRERSLETTGILALASLILGLLVHWTPWYVLAAGFLLIGLFLKRSAELVTRAWLAFAHALGTFNTTVLLALAYYLVLTPLAVFYRIVHGDFLRMGRSRKGPSLWHVRDHEYSAKDLEKMW